MLLYINQLSKILSWLPHVISSPLHCESISPPKKFAKPCWDLPIKSVPCNDENFKSNGENNKLKWMSLFFLRASPRSEENRPRTPHCWLSCHRFWWRQRTHRTRWKDQIIWFTLFVAGRENNSNYTKTISSLLFPTKIRISSFLWQIQLGDESFIEKHCLDVRLNSHKWH